MAFDRDGAAREPVTVTAPIPVAATLLTHTGSTATLPADAAA
jgi:hypothetical protein